MKKQRVTPESGALVEYATHTILLPRYQVYYRTGALVQTYVFHKAFQWLSEAAAEARDLDRRCVVKVYDAQASRWVNWSGV